MKLLLSGSAGGYRGTFVDFAGGRLNPLPAQKPHPPFIIGGETAAALTRIAKYGDGFHINWKTLSEFREILAQLAQPLADITVRYPTSTSNSPRPKSNSYRRRTISKNMKL